MKNTKRTKRVLAALLCVLLALCCAAASALAEGPESGGEILTVGVPVDRCPVFYRDAKSGEITGIGVDLMRAAAQEAGFGVRFCAIREATLKSALDNPDYDLVMPFGSAVPSASGYAVVVSDNLTQTPFTLVTAGSRELPPLNALRVGMLSSLGAGAETVRELFPGIEIEMYATMADCVKALRSGRVDALLHNSYVWSYVLQKPSYSDLSVQPSAMFSMDFRAGTLDTPEGRELIGRLNGGIAKLPDTLRQAVVLDHTTRRLYRYDFSDYLHQYGLILLLGMLLSAAIVAIIVLRWRSLRQEHEEKMRWLMDNDPLTGALSLNGFRKRVEELLRAHHNIPYMLTYINIKNFKYINDSLGMASGDDLLRFFVAKTRERLSDAEAVCRIEGDHFAVLSRTEGEEGLRESDRQVLDSVRSYYTDRGKETRVQLCGGIYVLTPEDYRYIDVDHMLDFARVAEKRIRDSHRDGYEIYNPKQWEKGKRTAEVVSHLPLALQSGELQVWYQPQVRYETGEIIGVEALSRWNHPKLGWLRPDEFIATLEEAGLIYDLDCYVWDKVCQDLRRWNEQGRHRSVSVNLSRCDIREDLNIPGQFFSLIQTYGLSADQLRVEITESAFAQDPELLIRTTVKLREFGFQVEMDDFGSGYSSLHMLKEVPVDRIKLDLHFLTGSGDVEKSRIIVSHVIQMVSALGMNLIAEGVENAAQARFLQSRGCAEMQGFYFYKPMTAAEYESLDASGGRAPAEP